ncbi:tol-pal system YbgF family protein [Bacteroidota bacterium]
MTTKYNVLYNGNLAFEKGLAEINEKYTDNYWDVLQIEPLEINKRTDVNNERAISNPSMPSLKSKDKDEKPKKQTAFDVAEAKAVKAVQRHSMFIKGKERNRKIDDAYLLLGKSRYYSQRFVPALEAFTYVIKNYPEASLIDEMVLWSAKANIRMQNEEAALESLTTLLDKPDVDEAILEDVHTTFAIAYTQLDSIEMILHHLEKAVSFKEDVQKKVRNLMVLGQLYRQQDSVNLSNRAFDQILELKKAPFEYKIHAKIEKIKNFEKGNSTSKIKEKLNKLIGNRDNRPYLDELYYQLAIIEALDTNRVAVIENYQNSIHATGAKEFQQGLSYQGLGDLYFKESDYALAGAYYDSVVQVSGEINDKRIRGVKKRSKSLVNVIAFEELIRVNDSILKVSAMSEEDQIAFYEAHIEIIKEIDAAKLKEEELKKKLAAYADTGVASVGQSSPNSEAKGKWYFYNVQTLGYGAQEFKRNWGARKLTDNWRWSDTSIISSGELIENKQAEEVKEGEEKIPEKYQTSFYIKRLPKTEKELDSITRLRNNTYFQLGLIYKEQFKEPKLAITAFENLLSFMPERKLVLGANYHLYKIYKALNDLKAENYKNTVLNDFPESTFAQLILNVDDVSMENGSSIPAEQRYKELYYLYESQSYDMLLSEISNSLRIFEGSKLMPKLELLKAYTVLKLQGKAAFKKALEFVLLNYANTEEGAKAKELLETLKK